jgi:hypothetical protein
LKWRAEMISKQELNEYILDRSKSKKSLKNDILSKNRVYIIHQNKPDFNTSPWLDRYDMFKHLRSRVDQIKFEITTDMSDKDAIPCSNFIKVFGEILTLE